MSDRKRADGHLTPERVEWPKDGSPAAFVDLLTCLERAFHDGARWQTRAGTKKHGVAWTGPEIGGFRSTMPISWQLGPEGMDYAYNKDGSGTFLTHLLSVALQLGMEQGARQERASLRDAAQLAGYLTGQADRAVHSLMERVMPRKEDEQDAGDEDAAGGVGAD